jgi:glycosyltransferase involved in cell wall biosynthesis
VRQRSEAANWIAVKSLSYVKNLSARRLFSHIYFAFQALKIVKQIEPDLIYITLPPNSTAALVGKYAGRNRIKFVLDIVDMWPEALPFNNLAKKVGWLPFWFWRALRNKAFSNATKIITECDLYKQELNLQFHKNLDINTVYLTKRISRDDNMLPPDCVAQDTLNICYLGSINHIIDLDLILALADAINQKRKITVHIIGDGESRDALLQGLTVRNVDFRYYGIVFDEMQKTVILKQCSFGLNLLKRDTFVGLTYKSIDYFAASVPILNNIQYDSWKIVAENNAGFNIDKDNLNEVAQAVAKLQDFELERLKQNSREVFKRYFAYAIFKIRMEEVIGDLL